MANAQYPSSGEENKRRRKLAGKYVKDLRVKAGLSQLDLSKKLDLKFYTFISQVETGNTRVPPEGYRTWARALNVPVKEFTKNLLRYYDPYTFDALFDGDTVPLNTRRVASKGHK